MNSTDDALPPLTDEQILFAAENIRTSTVLAAELDPSMCQWCDRPALFKSKLANPDGTFHHCRHHFAGFGVEGNPTR